MLSFCGWTVPFLGSAPGPWGRMECSLALDIPFVIAHRPDGTSAGLGDIYAQALFLPYRKGKFVWAMGSGAFLPTATHRRLGTGKLTVAPVVAPVWFIPKRGFFFVKVQDYFSVAGEERPARSPLHDYHAFACVAVEGQALLGAA